MDEIRTFLFVVPTPIASLLLVTKRCSNREDLQPLTVSKPEPVTDCFNYLTRNFAENGGFGKVKSGTHSPRFLKNSIEFIILGNVIISQYDWNLP